MWGPGKKSPCPPSEGDRGAKPHLAGSADPKGSSARSRAWQRSSCSRPRGWGGRGQCYLASLVPPLGGGGSQSHLLSCAVLLLLPLTLQSSLRTRPDQEGCYLPFGWNPSFLVLHTLFVPESQQAETDPSSGGTVSFRPPSVLSPWIIIPTEDWVIIGHNHIYPTEIGPFTLGRKYESTAFYNTWSLTWQDEAKLQRIPRPSHVLKENVLRDGRTNLYHYLAISSEGLCLLYTGRCSIWASMPLLLSYNFKLYIVRKYCIHWQSIYFDWYKGVNKTLLRNNKKGAAIYLSGAFFRGT